MGLTQLKYSIIYSLFGLQWPCIVSCQSSLSDILTYKWEYNENPQTIGYSTNRIKLSVRHSNFPQVVSV